MVTMAEKIRVVIKRKGITLTELASRLGMSRQNLHSKMERDNFSQEDLLKIAKVLEVGYESNFILEDGTII